jgi:acyl dehydratase
MNLEALRGHRFEPISTEFTDRDTMLYALSVGAGADPLSAGELALFYEKDLAALPSMSAVLAHPGPWIANPKFEVTWVKLLHGEQRAEIHRPLPPFGRVRAEYRVPAVVDKGADKGSLVYFEKTLFGADGDDPLCTVTATLFLRADGGQGGYGEAPAPLSAVPELEPSVVDELRIDPRAALLYRLNGDRNPIHVDPQMARKAGFEVPLLHGLCTYGMCCYSLLRTVFDYDPVAMKSLGVRFSAPVFPGETLRVEAWESDAGVTFQAYAVERGQKVISDGFAAR